MSHGSAEIVKELYASSLLCLRQGQQAAGANADIALIEGDWKLIESSAGERALYNLATDISESKDELSAQPETASRLIGQVESMKKDLPTASARRAGLGGRPGPRAQGDLAR